MAVTKIDKAWPQDAASKKARAIQRANLRHRRRSLKKKEPKLPKDIATLIPHVPSLRKKVNIVRKNPVSEVKDQIRVIKRQGGTLRFAKDLRTVRKQEQTKRAAQKVAAKAGKETPKKTGSRFKVCRMKRVYHTQLPLRTAALKGGAVRPKKVQTKLRKSLVPGTVCIIVAGRHQSKKVVFLKQLPRSGLCLVTGPYGLNKVPLRRCDQSYLIATSVKVPLPEGFKVPGHVDDFFFKKARGTKSSKTTKSDKDTLKKKSNTKKTTKKPDLVRKKAQRAIDKAVLSGMRKHAEGGMLRKYMQRCFTLIGDRYAHNIKF